MKSALTLLVLLFVLLFAPVRDVFPQAVETEPNAPCELAQGVGAISLPFSLTGALDALSLDGDVDFFSVRTTPGAGIEVTLEGLDSGKGTLRDPFLGVFDSSCRLISLNDDGSSLGSRVLATVPGDGIVILAATSCCDNTFRGQVGIGGSYELGVVPALLAGPISGRMVDAATLEPLGGDAPPYARAELYGCAGVNCHDWLGSAWPEADGEFDFSSDYRGAPLRAGTYQLRFQASLYEDAESETFAMGDGEALDLGDVPLSPVPRIGSIAGRVVDSITGIPLTGGSPPFARAELHECDVNGCSGFVASTATDAEGRFRFEGASGSWAIPAGSYRVEVEAEEYRAAASAPIFVDFDEHVGIGDVAVEPYPMGFTEVRPCADLPPEGGVCRFSVRVLNRIDRPVEGKLWSIVESFSTGSLSDVTRFQAGFPRRMSIGPGESRVARFRFVVPDGVRDGATLCGEVFFGLGGAGAFFDTAGHRRVFCIQKGVTGAFRLLTKREIYEIGAEQR